MNQGDFTLKADDDNINELHNNVKRSITIEHKEGQSGLLCSNKKLRDCPSLRYEYIEDIAKMEKAFDILFEEVLHISLKAKRNDFKKEDNNICQSFDC